jgi:hypothetical protein
MKKIGNMTFVGLFALLLSANIVHAQGMGTGQGGYAPNWQMMEKLTPDKRQQAIEIQQKMMQMQMDRDEKMIQMEMKYRHDMMQMQYQLLDLYKGG